MAGYIAAWHPSSVPPRAAAFARQVVTAAAPAGRDRAKNQLGVEHHGGRVPAGLWARIVQRLLALNAVIWHNWQIDAQVKRSLIAYDH